MESNENNYKVYVLKFPNGKRYVGMTGRSLAVRWRKGEAYKDKNDEMYADIVKYGWDSIDKTEVYLNLTCEEAQEKERALIAQYDTIENGYNTRKGGECAVPMKVDYNGKLVTFKELCELSDLPDLSKNNIRCRILRHGWDAQRAITQPTNVKLQPFGVGDRIYEYKGNMYNSYELAQMSEVEGLTTFDVSNRINHHGWSVEKAITQPKKGHNVIYEYNGNQYTSTELAELSPYDLAAHNITDRLRSGWSIEKAINTPLNKLKSHTSQSITKAV
jgi:hypothetical protein